MQSVATKELVLVIDEVFENAEQ